MKVYGPYKRADGRKHVIIINDDGSRYTQSYPRYLMEQSLGRKLAETETVDHINEDFTDDRIENLQLLSLAANAAKAMLSRPALTYSFICPVCNNRATKLLRNVTGNLKKGKKGPFCSRQCAGKAG